MGSLENLSIAAEGLILAVLGILALVRTRKGTVATLGLLWLGLALFDFSLLAFPQWTTWRDCGSYLIFITAMLYIGAKQRGWIR